MLKEEFIQLKIKNTKVFQFRIKKETISGTTAQKVFKMRK